MTEQTYTVIYGPTWWECMIKIDHGHIVTIGGTNEKWDMERTMREMVIFWSEGKDRLKLNDGDVTKTFLQQLAREICYLQAEYDYNLEGVIAAFENREGWWPMDGTCGVTICEVDDFEIAYGEFEVLPGTTGRRSRGHD